jgi:hypothetical protein
MQPNIVSASRAPRTSRFLGGLGLVAAAAVLLCGVATLAGSTLQAAESGSVAGVSSTPFTFDSPTATLHHVKGVEKPAAATAKADTLVLRDWKYTAQITGAEAFFLAGVWLGDTDELGAATVMVLFPGFTELVESIAGPNPIAQFIVIDILATILFGENLFKKEEVTPVSPTH